MKERRPIAVLMSKRANVFYLEHVRLIQRDGRLMYLTETGQAVEKIVNIPDKNTAIILLGKGTSITDAAARKLAESNIMLGFCGSGGSPLFSANDITFLVPQDEYRPTEYMQSWVKAWFEEDVRLDMAKAFLRKRIEWAQFFWQKQEVEFLVDTTKPLETALNELSTTTEILAHEANYAKRVYAKLAQHYEIDFIREEGKRSKSNVADKINGYLDHGNYIAYGYAACALHTLGISFAFPVLHGKTRRGALVFDVADLVKDWLVMPTAFYFGFKDKPDNEFRAHLIDLAQKYEVLDQMISFLKEVIQNLNEINEIKT